MLKEYILRALVIISGIVFFVSLFNFKNPISIPGNVEDNFFVMAAGIDLAKDENNKYKITIVGEKFSSDTSGGSSSGGKKTEIVTIEGKTIFETIRNFVLYKDSSIFWGHIKYLLISEETAKENILDVLDFFIRDHELRFDNSIVIVKGTSAESFIRAGCEIEIFITDLLDGAFANVGKLSFTSDIKLGMLMQTFDNVYSDVYLPAISLVLRENDEVDVSEIKNEEKVPTGGGKFVGTNIEKDDKSQEENDIKEEGTDKKKDKQEGKQEEGKQEEGKQEGKQEGKVKQEGGQEQKGSEGESSSSESVGSSSKAKSTLYINLDGYAIFNGTKLMGYITNKVSRGLNWANSKIESTVLIVENEKDKKPISIEVINSNTRTIIKMNGDKPEAKIEIKFATNITEVMTQENPFIEEIIDKLNEQQNNIVKSEVEDIIKFAQENEVDIFGMNDAIYHQHPLEWEKIQDKWKETFKDMKIEVEVKSNISRTYHIRQPIRSGTGGK